MKHEKKVLFTSGSIITSGASEQARFENSGTRFLILCRELAPLIFRSLSKEFFCALSTGKPPRLGAFETLKGTG